MRIQQRGNTYMSSYNKTLRVMYETSTRCYEVFSLFPPDDDGSHHYYKEDALPEWLRGKVALLQMLNVGDGLVDIGVRVATNVYWVLGNEQEVVW
jgi:hypothetical protein